MNCFFHSLLNFSGQEFWIGLDHIYQMTQKKDYSLRIVMENFAGTVKIANYATFRLTENVSISYC
jgi:hypothetical protein